MELLPLASLVFFLAAAAGGAAFATIRGFRAWRAVQRLQRTVGAGVNEVTRGVEDIESRLADAGESATALGRATARLDRSIAGLRVMTAAAGDARAALYVLAFLRR